MKYKSVAVIGGGIAGLYAAWRILHADADCQVSLFEADDHLGGRIQSASIPGIPFKAELGAMRFRSNHLLLQSLLDELRIPTRLFDVRPPRLRVRGRSLSAKELAEGSCRHCHAGAPYILRPDERGKTAEQLVMSCIHWLLHDLSFPDLRQGEAQRAKQKIKDDEISSSLWRLIKEHGWYENTPLFKIGFWNLLQHHLSNEAFQLVHDALSLESVLGNWSAAEAIPWFKADFSSSELFMVPDGMQSLVERLEASASRKGGPRLKLYKRTAVRRCERSDQTWTLFAEPEGAEPLQGFDALILALPKAALEKIHVSDKAAAPWRPKWLSFVQPHVLYKLFLLFENEWWMGDDEPGYSVGRTYTDLPIRQVYYFSPRWMRECSRVAEDEELKATALREDTKHWSLVMASYSDEHYVNFWRPFSGGDEAPYYKAPSTIGRESEKQFRKQLDTIDPRVRASERIVKKVQQQLGEIHGHNIPEPILGLYKDWGGDPFGGGWHTWNVGTKPWDHKPFPNGDPEWPADVYVCGEAYSEEQGWIEGALKTVERVLRAMCCTPAKYKFGWAVSDLDAYVGDDGDSKVPPEPAARG